MTFGLQQYRLEYAVWAAYRAAQAGSSKAKGPELSEALRQCGVIAYLDNYKGEGVDKGEYKKLHDEWCAVVIAYLRRTFEKEVSYGVAAKLLGIFIKGYFILAGNEHTPLAKVAHPPIDSYLLKGVDKNKGTKLDRDYKWQKLNKEKYYELLEKLREILRDGEEFWHIEKYWRLG